jgi:hypothetical protein
MTGTLKARHSEMLNRADLHREGPKCRNSLTPRLVYFYVSTDSRTSRWVATVNY